MRRLCLLTTSLVVWGTSLGAAFAADAFSDAEREAIFAAAGFKKAGNEYTRCEDDVTASKMNGFLETADLNKDGQNEVFVRESSLFCYGHTAEAFVLLRKDDSGTWIVILDQIGMALERETATNGWVDIEVGGPGMGPFPVYKFDGTKYVSG